MYLVVSILTQLVCVIAALLGFTLSFSLLYAIGLLMGFVEPYSMSFLLYVTSLVPAGFSYWYVSRSIQKQLEKKHI